MDCADLQLTLAGNGISVEVETGVPSDFGADAHVCVDRADVERAIPIVEHFNERRAKRFDQIMAKTADTLSEFEIEPQPVPDYLALPLIQHGTLVDDEDLQAIWAQLIASASSGSAESAVWHEAIYG